MIAAVSIMRGKQTAFSTGNIDKIFGRFNIGRILKYYRMKCSVIVDTNWHRRMSRREACPLGRLFVPPYGSILIVVNSICDALICVVARNEAIVRCVIFQ